MTRLLFYNEILSQSKGTDCHLSQWRAELGIYITFKLAFYYSTALISYCKMFLHHQEITFSLLPFCSLWSCTSLWHQYDGEYAVILTRNQEITYFKSDIYWLSLKNVLHPDDLVPQRCRQRARLPHFSMYTQNMFYYLCILCKKLGSHPDTIMNFKSKVKKVFQFSFEFWLWHFFQKMF